MDLSYQSSPGERIKVGGSQEKHEPSEGDRPTPPPEPPSTASGQICSTPSRIRPNSTHIQPKLGRCWTMVGWIGSKFHQLCSIPGRTRPTSVAFAPRSVQTGPNSADGGPNLARMRPGLVGLSRTRPRFGRSRSNLAPGLVNLGPILTQFAPNLVDVGIFPPQLGEMWTEFHETWHELVKTGATPCGRSRLVSGMLIEQQGVELPQTMPQRRTAVAAARHPPRRTLPSSSRASCLAMLPRTRSRPHS